MWFDVKAALLEIEGSTPATTANTATIRLNQAGIHPIVADVAVVAGPQGDNSLFVKTDNIEFEERAGIIANNGAPEQWVSGYATLVSLPCPENWTQEKWDKVLISAEKFLAEWGAQAHRLGWATNDLFGISHNGSTARLDCLGLVLFLDSNRVTHMTDKTAILQCLNHRTGEPNGSTLTFYRKQDMSGSVPLWGLEAVDEIIQKIGD